MTIIVSGSLAYDRIMDFPGNFSDHILPQKIHVLNVSFTVNGMVEKLGVPPVTLPTPSPYCMKSQ